LQVSALTCTDESKGQRRGIMPLYTVFTPNGAQRRNEIGLAVLCRHLRSTLRYARAGDTVQRWGTSGNPAGKWTVTPKGTLHKVGGR